MFLVLVFKKNAAKADACRCFCVCVSSRFSSAKVVLLLEYPRTAKQIPLISQLVASLGRRHAISVTIALREISRRRESYLICYLTYGFVG